MDLVFARVLHQFALVPIGGSVAPTNWALLFVDVANGVAGAGHSAPLIFPTSGTIDARFVSAFLQLDAATWKVV